MIGDGGLRGATLEACVAKIKLSAGEYDMLVEGTVAACDHWVFCMFRQRDATGWNECYAEQHF